MRRVILGLALVTCLAGFVPGVCAQTASSPAAPAKTEQAGEKNESVLDKALASVQASPAATSGEDVVVIAGYAISLKAVLDILMTYALRLLAAAVILVVGLRIARGAGNMSRSLLGRRGVSSELTGFVSGIARYALALVVIIMALAQAGVNVTSLLALFGAAGLAVGLAMKDTLANFASGVMLLFFRFYRIGDAVGVAGVEGKVESLEIFNTVIRAGDGKKIIVPNSKIVGGVIVVDESARTQGGK